MNSEDFQNYDVIPVVRELSADTLTPRVAFAALSGADSEAFLFESVERGENLGRYSFIGFEPRRNLVFDRTVSDPVRILNDELVPLRVKGEELLPPFFGGAVGYFGYNVAGWSERIPDTRADDLNIPDAKLLFFDNVVVFDHVRQRLFVVANVFTKDGMLSIAPTDAVADANIRLDRAIERRADLVSARCGHRAVPLHAHARSVRADGAARTGRDRGRRDLPDRALAALGDRLPDRRGADALSRAPVDQSIALHVPAAHEGMHARRRIAGDARACHRRCRAVKRAEAR